MPYTAKLVSKQAKLPYSKSRLTTDPEYNINLGISLYCWFNFTI
jgi:soluble lytic murein transglycosylase